MSRKFWAAFNAVGGVGPVAIRRLLDRFGDLEAAWSASASELGAAGLDRATATAVVQQRPKIDPDAIMSRLEAMGGHLLLFTDPQYPRRLREIDDSPPLLYTLGDITPNDEWAVAIVGTRQATAYGLQVTEKLAGDLARSQVTVVSGLALGVDGRAHRTALEAGGRTIAVLGSGIDQVYPPEHRRLAESIVRQGAIVSEYPQGTPPLAKNFPNRNRVIAGLCLGVVIVEGDVTSGARFTADFAGEQGREVFAVPGNIFSARSALPHRLLQDGAKLVTNADDILSELNLALVPQQMEMREVLPADPTEAALLGVLSAEPRHIDEIVRATGLPISVVSSNLTMMELKGMVRRAGGMSFVARS
jgi:DNA processing protein